MVIIRKFFFYLSKISRLEHLGGLKTGLSDITQRSGHGRVNMSLAQITRYQLLKSRIFAMGAQPARSCFQQNPADFWLNVYLPFLTWTALGGRLNDEQDPYRYYDHRTVDDIPKPKGELRRWRDMRNWKNKYFPLGEKCEIEERFKRMFPEITETVVGSMHKTALEFLCWGLLRFWECSLWSYVHYSTLTINSQLNACQLIVWWKKRRNAKKNILF